MSDNKENAAPEIDQVAKEEEKKVASRKEELEKEIADLEKKYVITRSVIEQADITSKLGKLRVELKELERGPVINVYQKEVPVRVDHMESKPDRIAYQPQDDGKTFITTL